MRRTSSASFSFRDSCSANSPSCVSRYLTSSFKPSRVWAACSSISLLNFSSRRLKKRNIKDLNLSDSCGHKSYHHCHGNISFCKRIWYKYVNQFLVQISQRNVVTVFERSMNLHEKPMQGSCTRNKTKINEVVMQEAILISITGMDRPGITASVTQVLAEF